VCLNTYGSFDNIVKLLQDNGVDNINQYPISGQVFNWDETLSADQFVNTNATNANIIYATKALKNGNIFSLIQTRGKGGIGGPALPPSYYNPPNTSTMIKYQLTAEAQYIAAGGETSVILSDLIGSSIIQLQHEIKPLLTSEYSFNPNTGQITFTSLVLVADESLFIIYGKILLS
jgi:hypothetical protein